jgi:hypothetical protein
MTVDRAMFRERKTGHPVLSQRCETIGISGKGHNDHRVRHCKQWSRVADTFQWLQAYRTIVLRGPSRLRRENLFIDAAGTPGSSLARVLGLGPAGKGAAGKPLGGLPMGALGLP